MAFHNNQSGTPSMIDIAFIKTLHNSKLILNTIVIASSLCVLHNSVKKYSIGFSLISLL